MTKEETGNENTSNFAQNHSFLYIKNTNNGIKINPLTGNLKKYLSRYIPTGPVSRNSAFTLLAIISAYQRGSFTTLSKK